MNHPNRTGGDFNVCSRLLEQYFLGPIYPAHRHRSWEVAVSESSPNRSISNREVSRGDGLLAEFGSVVDAVECAVALQQSLAERNGDAADDRRIEIRIGVN